MEKIYLSKNLPDQEIFELEKNCDPNELTQILIQSLTLNTQVLHHLLWFRLSNYQTSQLIKFGIYWFYAQTFSLI